MTKVLILAALLVGPTFGQSRESRLNAGFKEYRSRLISTIEADPHPECLLKRIVPDLRRAVIVFAYSEEQTRAWCFRDASIGALVVVINSRISWNFESAAVTLAHELLHLVGVCGPDVKIPDGIPVCSLFGQPAFTSQDISNAVRRHLALKD